MSSTRIEQASLTRNPAPYISMYSARYFGERNASKIAATSVPLRTTGWWRGTFGLGMTIATSGLRSVTRYKNFSAAA